MLEYSPLGGIDGFSKECLRCSNSVCNFGSEAVMLERALDTNHGDSGILGSCGIGCSVVVLADSVLVESATEGCVRVPASLKTTFLSASLGRQCAPWGVGILPVHIVRV